MKKIGLVLALVLGFAAALPAAEPPESLNYQGILRDSLDAPIDGTPAMVFRFYSVSTGGAALLEESHGTVQVTGGLFNVRLGAGAMNPAMSYTSLADLFGDEGELYLGVQVGSDPEMTPRIPLNAAAWALNAHRLDGMEGTDLLRSNADEAFTSGTLTFNPGTALDLDGHLRMDGLVTKATTGLVSNFNADLLDGLDASAFTEAGAAWNLTGNAGTAGSAFLGTTDAQPMRLGVDNDIQLELDAQFNFVAGDTQYFTLQDGVWAGTISGGGGYGAYQWLYDNLGVIGGGGGNQVGNGNSDVHDAMYATVAGGSSNTAAGGYSAIPGGELNTAAGHHSFAAGRGAQANHDGSFVWADSTWETPSDFFASTGANQFLIKASGGVGIGTNNPQGALTLLKGDPEDDHHLVRLLPDSPGWGASEMSCHYTELTPSFTHEMSSTARLAACEEAVVKGAQFTSSYQAPGEERFWSATVNLAGIGTGGRFVGQELDGSGVDPSYEVAAELARAGDSQQSWDTSFGGRFELKNLNVCAFDFCALTGEPCTSGGTPCPGPEASARLALKEEDGSGYGIWATGSDYAGFFDGRVGVTQDLAVTGEISLNGNPLKTNALDAADGSPSNALYVDNEGEVGIGTTDPVAALEVIRSDGQSGAARVAEGHRGIWASGNLEGGYFKEADDPDGHTYARAAYNGRGVEAYGREIGGYFETKLRARGYVGYGDRGIEASGAELGGYFWDRDEGGWAYVGYSSSMIVGSGAASHQQNHPEAEDQVLAYNSLAGDETAVYTRGTARLSEGEARVRLGATLKWVANPDIGLTAHLTPREDSPGLYVDSLTSEEMVVREVGGGTGDTKFDYLVMGLRIGFEEASIAQEKKQEAYIPSMGAHRALYEKRPELREFNALERYKTMRREFGETGELDLSASQQLKSAIQEYDPAVHGTVESVIEVSRRAQDIRKKTGASEESSAGAATKAENPPVDDEGNVYGRSFRPSAADLASLVRVSEPVEAGDVLAIDPEKPGLMSLARVPSDTAVFGIVASEPGVVLGTPPAERIARSSRDLDTDSSPIDEPAQRIASDVPVALSGLVRCKVDAGFGAIRPGDLLTTSPTPGHAMIAHEPQPGTILGKALEPLDAGTGMIKVLVMLR